MLQFVMLALLGTALADPAAGPEEGDSPQEDPASRGDDFEAVLEHAKEVYFAGRDDEALEIFTGLQVRLLLGETPPWDLAATALIYVGEIQYRRGNHDEARDAFRWLLLKDPDYQISPYSHPIEVVAVFSTVRDQVRRSMGETTTEEAPIDPMPAWGYLPLGLPQFRSKRPVAGVVFGGLQLGLTAASIGVYANLAYLNSGFPEQQGNDWLPSEHPRGWSMKDTPGNINRVRYTVNLPLAVLAYGSYFASVFEARGHWRRNFEPQVRVSFAPSTDGSATLILSGRL